MEGIKRYAKQTLRIRGQEPFTTMGIIDNGDYVKYTDHKSVVETRDKTILTLTDINDNKTKYICELEHEKKAMQNKIEELEKLNESMRCCGNCRFADIYNDCQNHKNNYGVCAENKYNLWVKEGSE